MGLPPSWVKSGGLRPEGTGTIERVAHVAHKQQPRQKLHNIHRTRTLDIVMYLHGQASEESKRIICQNLGVSYLALSFARTAVAVAHIAGVVIYFIVMMMILVRTMLFSDCSRTPAPNPPS